MPHEECPVYHQDHEEQKNQKTVRSSNGNVFDIKNITFDIIFVLMLLQLPEIFHLFITKYTITTISFSVPRFGRALLEAQTESARLLFFY